MHDCFIRELKPGARQINSNPDIIISPCDAIIGAQGKIENGTLFQAKGFPYTPKDLLADEDLVTRYQSGIYITLRLKSTMYHRFHAPCVGSVKNVTYISGGTWNVNSIVLKRVEKLYCKNERVVIELQLILVNSSITLAPAATIDYVAIYGKTFTYSQTFTAQPGQPCFLDFATLIAYSLLYG